MDSDRLYYYSACYYDHELARFTQADTIVQDPYDPQTLNRYTYCRNNPIKYVDPTGHFFWGMIIGAIIGSLIGGAVAAITGGDIGKGFLTGAISGAIFGVVGYLGPDGIGVIADGVPQTASHVIAGAASGAINATITGSKIGINALIGGVSAGAGNLVGHSLGFLADQPLNGVDDYVANLAKRAAVGAVMGGAISSATGGSFGQGARLGAISSAIAYTCNEALHEAQKALETAKQKRVVSRVSVPVPIPKGRHTLGNLNIEVRQKYADAYLYFNVYDDYSVKLYEITGEDFYLLDAWKSVDLWADSIRIDAVTGYVTAAKGLVFGILPYNYHNIYGESTLTIGNIIDKDWKPINIYSGDNK